MTTTVKSATPFGQAPVASPAGGLLSADANGNAQVSAPGLVQVSVAPVAAPTGVAPTAVYCTADKKFHVYDSATSTWVASVALA